MLWGRTSQRVHSPGARTKYSPSRTNWLIRHGEGLQSSTREGWISRSHRDKGGQTRESGVREERGLQTWEGGKAGSSERFGGSPFLNYSCFGTKMRSGLWLFNPPERDSKWLLAPESELVVESRGRLQFPSRKGAESRSVRDLRLWIIKVKAKIGNDLAFV